MLGVADSRPTVEDMIMPVPTNGLKVISIGMLKPRRDQVVAWRGPILDRALTQMLGDVYWGDLDFLLLDLPPGTGDVAIPLGQKLPNAEVLVVTTPQAAAAEVAERAGTMASMLNQRVIGVVENMSHLVTTCPHCGKYTPLHLRHRRRRGCSACPEHPARLSRVASRRYRLTRSSVLPVTPAFRWLRPARTSLPPALSTSLAETFVKRGRGLLGKQLGLAPAGR